MIGKLRGRVDSHDGDSVILDVNGVGYLIFASGRTLNALPAAGHEASLLIDTHVREDHIHLYGFGDQTERAWFRLLTTVQGVGVRHALAILSVLSPHETAQAVASQDKQALTRASGVGPKLASRIVLELKDKAGHIATEAGVGGAAAARSGGDAGDRADSVSEDAVSALANLGYKRSEAFGAVASAVRRLGPGASVQALITEGLKDLSQ